jgi:D-alanyl-lipoteichoic acid acyltransferase DltB (MBOAT superfamily)
MTAVAQEQAAAQPRIDALSSALVIAGALICFLTLTLDYYRDAALSLGTKQILMLAAGVAALCGGIGWQVAAGRRALDEVWKFALIAGQLALTAYVIKSWEIEARVFYDVVILLILFGFIAHHFVKPSWRPALFFFIGLAAIVAVLGQAYPMAAALLIAFSLGLFMLANLPIGLRWRVGLIGAFTLVMAALQMGLIKASWANIVVPLLASMFMFRLVLYLYDMRNGRGPKNWWTRLSYFFLPPNPMFPFFPVVDFATFGRTYYNAPALEIYQRGVHWIVRGVIHLLIYRIVYLYFTLAPESVSSPGEFLHYIVANFALYLRISSLFHLIVGLLLLFGFNLHETHSSFYFSTSFIDFWRRINIYWKDFMQKIVFNPAFARLKKFGVSHLPSVLGAMAIVFLATWALHAYQWFWMRGSVLFTWPDFLFWALLGAFLIVQTYRQETAPKAAARGAYSPLRARALLVLRTICTFLTICVLWAFWASPSLAAWGELLSDAGLMPVLGGRDFSAAAWAATLASGALGLFILLIALGVSFGLEGAPAPRRPARKAAPMHPLLHTAIAAGLCGALLAPFTFKDALDINTQLAIEDVGANHLNARDRAAITRGYYEDLTNTNRFNSRLWEALMFRPIKAQVVADQPGMRQRSDYMQWDFRPNSDVVGIGAVAHINRWGMRGKDVQLAKPPGTIRIAIVEASRAVGLGVPLEDLFGSVLEKNLNARYGGEGRRFEVLNFSIHGHLPVQRLMVLEERVFQFKPDFTLYIGGGRENNAPLIAFMYRRGTPAPYPVIDDVIARAGLRREMSQSRMEALLEPYKYDVLGYVYDRFAADSRKHGATPIYFYLPPLGGVDPWDEDDVERQRALARHAGFLVLNLDNVYAGGKVEQMKLTDNDYTHPNAIGHAMIAAALEKQLIAKTDIRFADRDDDKGATQ